MDYWGAIISVSAAIIGVIIGFVLERISASGRITFYLNTFNIHYLTQAENGEIVETKELSEAKFAKIFFEIDIYNSAGKNKIIRQFKLDVINEGNLLNGHLGDFDTKAVVGRHTEIKIPRSFIITPKSVSSRQFQFLTNEKPPDLTKSDYFISYINEKNKVVKCKLKIDPFIE